MLQYSEKIKKGIAKFSNLTITYSQHLSSSAKASLVIMEMQQGAGAKVSR